MNTLKTSPLRTLCAYVAVSMLAGPGLAAEGFFLSGDTAITSLDVMPGQENRVEFGIVPEIPLGWIEPYYYAVDFRPSSPGLGWTGWQDRTGGNLLGGPPSVFVESALVPGLPASPLILGELGFVAPTPGVYVLDWDRTLSCVLDPLLGTDWIGFGQPLVVYAGEAPPPPPGGLFAPTLSPYTATANANWSLDVQVNAPAYASGERWECMGPMMVPSYATSSVRVDQQPTAATIGIELWGNGGLCHEEWFDPEHPENPPIFFDHPIPADASGEVDGSLCFEPTEQLPAGTVLDLTMYGTATGQPYALWWSCTLYRDQETLATVDSNNPMRIVRVVVGESLRVVAEAFDYCHEPWESFDDTITITLTGVPEPTVLGVLGAAGVCLLRRRR